MSKNICLFSLGKTYQKFPFFSVAKKINFKSSAACNMHVPCPGFRIMIKKGFVKMSPASECS